MFNDLIDKVSSFSLLTFNGDKTHTISLLALLNVHISRSISVRLI